MSPRRIARILLMQNHRLSTFDTARKGWAREPVMSEPFTEQIDHPSAWKGSDFNSEDDFAFAHPPVRRQLPFHNDPLLV